MMHSNKMQHIRLLDGSAKKLKKEVTTEAWDHMLPPVFTSIIGVTATSTMLPLIYFLFFLKNFSKRMCAYVSVL